MGSFPEDRRLLAHKTSWLIFSVLGFRRNYTMPGQGFVQPSYRGVLYPILFENGYFYHPFGLTTSTRIR